MVQSMTGFANGQGQSATASWTWEIRSVNARGLDIRVRLPDGFEKLEPVLKKKIAKFAARGNVSVGLRVKMNEAQTRSVINQAALNGYLVAVGEVEQSAMDAHVTLAPMTAADILAMRGVVEVSSNDTIPKELETQILAQFDDVLADFIMAKSTEGDALAAVLVATLDDVEGLQTQAKALSDARLPKVEATLKGNVERLLAANTDMDADRLAQELAVLAVKSDITEELDRLNAHVAAGRALLASDGAMGRKFDFLTQEFNREVNTICSKSGDTALTQVGLDLKTRIDQMREQVQNVE